jgi:hypothetical protein
MDSPTRQNALDEREIAVSPAAITSVAKSLNPHFYRPFFVIFSAAMRVCEQSADVWEKKASDKNWATNRRWCMG